MKYPVWSKVLDLGLGQLHIVSEHSVYRMSYYCVFFLVEVTKTLLNKEKIAKFCKFKILETWKWDFEFFIHAFSVGLTNKFVSP